MREVIRHLVAGASAVVIFPALCFAQFGAIAGVVKDSSWCRRSRASRLKPRAPC